MTRYRFLLPILCLCLRSGQGVQAFYLPEQQPQSYLEGEIIPLKVNAVTSPKTQIPLDYYSFPFCRPNHGVHKDNENIGEFLVGDRIESSPYILRMKEDFYCKQVCVTNLGRKQSNYLLPNKLSRAIEKNYNNNWIVDNLPAAQAVPQLDAVRYFGGFPLGFVLYATRNTDTAIGTYVYNHVNLKIFYKPDDNFPNTYRIIRFLVEPLSIKHNFKYDNGDDSFEDEDDSFVEDMVQIVDPIPSCNRNYQTRQHTQANMVAEFQEPSGQVLFTYDVIWEETEVSWSERWDIYILMGGAVQPEVHWYSIANSFITVVFLSFIVGLLLVRNLYRDLLRYNASAIQQDDRLEEMGEYNWRMVHGDVFRPPLVAPDLFAVACGTGTQLLCTAFVVITFGLLGFMSPARRGHLIMGEVMIYVCTGSVNGYVTAKLCRTFGGGSSSWRIAATKAALGLPSLFAVLFVCMSVIAIVNRSTYAVSLMTIPVLAILGFFVYTPLVFFGAYFGYKSDPIDFATKTSEDVRAIPPQPWYLNKICTFAVGGFLPFSCSFVEFYYILSAIWWHTNYYVFGFVFLVFVLLLITCAENAAVLTYFQIAKGDYRWWWRSFLNVGATAIYAFLYSVSYMFSQLGIEGLSGALLYLGYMGFCCFCLFLMVGCVGVAASLLLNQLLFGTVAVQRGSSLLVQYSENTGEQDNEHALEVA